MRSPSPTSSDAVATVAVSVQKTKPAVTADKRPSKKNKRPSQRFLWQEDLHLRFVAAIFDLGLKNASPKALLPLMKKSDPDSGLTTEHLKSHLQKYCINYERSHQKFQELCDREVKRDRKRRRRQEDRRSSAAEAFAFPVRERCDSITAKSATDSDSVLEGDDNASRGANTVGEEDRQMRPFVCSRELAAATASIAASRYPAEYVPVQRIPAPIPVSSGMPELTDAQWRTFSMLMSVPSQGFDGRYEDATLSIQIPQEMPPSLSTQAQVQYELQLQMHQAMQAQMSFHRQMLTRKVELSQDLHQRDGVENWSSNCSLNNAQVAERSGFQEAWASSQQMHQRQLASHRLQQQLYQYGAPLRQTASEATCSAPEPLKSASLPSLVAGSLEEPMTDTNSDAVDEDLNRWDPFNVGLDGDGLFDFLKA
ncbi:hypothetical protein PHYPSEUDO_006453 [Phytophthora pseudosyringae]|uniref:HTH myb-type domain-containing protein n=1 Tax=Phytophthora pseudosyringae TaxID=221518 RepID=A0A8T1VLJ5_9STRA|nr:hypothetical protein PHYPSEUDO_006453 [Phytophthora pseudosyringae]